MTNNKEKCDLSNSNALEDAVSYFNRGFEILTREASRVREEKEAFDSVSKKLKEAHFGKTVRLNIGGQYFTTSVHTLTKDPGSMLNAMFSGRFETQPSEDGSFFIDRDGTYFRYILNYLRTGKLLLPKDELVRIRDELLAEAEYYQIQGILDELTRKFGDSVILNSEQASTLVKWLPPEDSELGEVVLLYRASRDGWSSSDFHRLCDHKGPTITVVRVGTNVFGGYTEQSWHGSIYKQCTKAFLFTLVNSQGVGATKMNMKSCKAENGIYCNNSQGPTFGGGHDFVTTNTNSNNGSYSHLGHSYQVPASSADAKSLLAGSHKFSASELEVFGYMK